MKKVITYGSFDLFHTGHYNLLKRAKALGDHLIVGVTSDFYDEYRGKLNIYEPLLKRIENVKNCGFADEVIIEEHEGQKLADIQKYGIDIFAIGSDWRGKFDYLKEYCNVVYLERTKDISSTQLRAEHQGIIRLGMAGTGRIASRFVTEAAFVSGITLSAVYNPRKESAVTFAERFELGNHTDDYTEFLGHVDAAYIATPHQTHYDYAKKALLAGKHVLCEKPLVMRHSQAEELYQLAQTSGLVLMEAVKTAYLPGFLQLLTLVKSGRIGKVRDVEACFTKLLPPGRTHRELEGATGGSFTELGTYPLLAILKILGCDYEDVRFECLRDAHGADVYSKAYFTYKDAFATAKVGLGVKSEGQLLVSGTNGYILVESPWWLTKAVTVCYENRECNERYYTKMDGEGLRYEIATFVRQIWDKSRHNYKMQPKESLAIASIIEGFLAWRDSGKN